MYHHICLLIQSRLAEMMIITTIIRRVVLCVRELLCGKAAKAIIVCYVLCVRDIDVHV